MARMHSRKRGKARSRKPSKRIAPTWVRYKDKEAEMLIVKLAKEGKTPSQVGLHLRDVYGIPDVKSVTKKKISAILKEKKLLAEIPEDLTALIKKSIRIKKHLEGNNKDQTVRRGLLLTESKINRLIRYYKETKKLPLEWKYDPEKAGMFIE